MNDRQNQLGAGPATLLFGPLALSFDAATVAQLRQNIIDNTNYRWMLHVLADLPQQWGMIVGDLPELEDAVGRAQVEDLAEAFQIGKPLDTPFPLPNKLLIPLVVLSHLTQYASYLERSNIEADDRVDIFAGSKANREAVGFCTGLLSAIAVSCSGSKEQFHTYGAAAVRLGMLVGVVVDAHDGSSSRSLSVAWSSAESHEKMQSVFADIGNVS
jgi:hypothetical protein